MTYQCKGLLEEAKDIPGLQKFVEDLKIGKSGKIINTVDSCKSHLITTVGQLLDVHPIIIAPDELSAKKLYEDMQLFYEEKEVYLYPARDILFYNADVHSMDITAERMKIIHQLVNQKEGIFILPAEALLNPLMPKQTWLSYEKTLTEGEVVQLKQLGEYLLEIGYERVAKVEAVGQYAIRGGIIDLFIPHSPNPYRIELWDDEIDSIRTFNPTSQRSVEKVNSVTICPVREVIVPIKLLEKAIPKIREEYEKTRAYLSEQGKKESVKTLEHYVETLLDEIQSGTLAKNLELYSMYANLQTTTILDYLPTDTLYCIDEPVKMSERCKRLLEEYEESMKDRLEYGHVLPSQIDFIHGFETITYTLGKKTFLSLCNFETKDTYFSTKHTLSINAAENTTFYNHLDLLEKDLKKWKNEGKKIVILTGLKKKAQRMIDELELRGVFASYSEHLTTKLLPGQIVLTKGALNKGFIYEAIDLYVIADKDLFGKEKKKIKPKKKYQGSKIDSFLELTPGDYVVHENHGIGIFKGIEQIVIEEIAKDNLKIEYANNAMLYVNINQMDMVQKYVGPESKPPKLSKLGTSDWKKSKAKVKGAVEDIAKDLIKIYSQRHIKRGFKYEEDSIWQQEFEGMFPYEETSDQIQAIEEVKKDMESDKIMDRLVCGDVGFGKTEVAIRAAFKAVQNSKQVAYLVPTTILAQQHYQRFCERMGEYPVTVGVLSRFRTPKQIKETIEGIRKGTVDIVIGTHRLLSKDVQFRDLGLVIIDEEQRFGVKHKEKLKEMRTEVDVLTLTATPIPRTLHMSLIGIRDMSVLEEAPLERRPVQTYVLEYSEDFIKDAINRELVRGGQVYFLHNQVRDIEEKALQIQKMVPQAKVGFAHGQMSERELEHIMLAYIEKEIDVLVCTTIVETGLDIANANTIIINDADRMGLSQLYQLRGRVGRSNKAAYAYLMYKRNKVLKEVAEKRLQAIKQFTQLGAGFKIAMRDLEIRGAGNLLGAKQHGHMEAIGYDLYCKMLQEAVAFEKGEITKEKFETSIEMKINAYIPSEYIEDEVQRLDSYKKIACITSQKDYNELQEELEDRYGTLPQCVENLLSVALIKEEANALDIISIIQLPDVLKFTFKNDAHLNPTKLQEVLTLYPRKMKWMINKTIVLQVNIEGVPQKQILGYIKNTLQELKKLKNT